MIGNIVNTSFPQGIACYECYSSIFTDNVLTTLPGSSYRTSMNIVGGGHNIISNNVVTAYTKPVAITPVRDGFDDMIGGAAEDPVFMERMDQLLVNDLDLLQSGFLTSSRL